MSEQNKAMVRKLFEETVNKGDLTVIEQSFASDFIYHGDPQFNGADGVKNLVRMFRGGFPDINITIEDQMAEGDMVVTRYTGRGTHTGELMGIPATGKTATVTGISIMRVVDGKCVEEWENMDMLGMMQQLGVIPTE